MPIPSIPDETPAWIKGDLPAEASAVDTQPSRPAGEQAGIPVPELLEPADEPAQPEPPPASAAVEPSTSTAEAAAITAPAPELPVAPEDHRPNPELGHSEPAVTAPALPEPPVVEELSLGAQIESLLFVADGAVTVGRLAEALEVSSREVEAALTELGRSYRQRGLSLQRIRDKVQMTTSPSAAARVERFLGLAAASPLSRAALETLAIVAYQQPVTRPQLEAVRGVNSDSVIKNLLSKGLIEESGRAEGPGRPVLYSTTPEFMQHFGLASLADLPPLALPGSDTTASPERILKG